MVEGWKMQLEWWSPLVGCVSGGGTIDEVWHLWGFFFFF